jgi:hypothetical protein
VPVIAGITGAIIERPLQKEDIMTEQTPTVTVVEEPTKQSLWSRINKQKLAKVATVTGGVALAGIYLKRKLNCSCDVSADASVNVETADQTDN